MSIFTSVTESETSRRPRTILWLAGAVLILLAAAAAYWLTRRPEAPPVKETSARAATAAPRIEPKDVPKVDRLAPSASSGAIEVTGHVDGASVYIDGELSGETPFEADSVSLGSHEIRVEKPGQRPFRQVIDVKPGRKTRVTVRLATEAAVLGVDSDVPGASVFVDRRYIGTTPVDARDLSPGAHQLTVSAEGYDMHAETIELGTASRDVMVRFKEVKLDESVQVVHKHRLGSCSGRLSATVQRMRFETADGKDAFSVPLSEVLGFEVDYIAKNLKLKLKGGRNYNFTEASGNTDVLYVFHQKVTAARK